MAAVLVGLQVQWPFQFSKGLPFLFGQAWKANFKTLMLQFKGSCRKGYLFSGDEILKKVLRPRTLPGSLF